MLENKNKVIKTIFKILIFVNKRDNF